MAAHDYYNSFNGGTPQMMPSNLAPYAPSSATAPPPYQEFHPSQANLHQQGQQQPYNIADFKYNYDPNITYGPSTPPQEYAPPARPPRQQQQVYQAPYASTANLHSRQQAPYASSANLQSHQQAPYASSANLRLKPPHPPYLSTTSLRPHRSSSEPPSPYQYRDERKHSSSRPHTSEHRRHHHSHSHSRRRSRSRSRSRSRDRGDREQRPRGKVHKEKNTFLGAIGGSVVGDLIFPGLGTLGGAILGGLGGHEASKKKERDRERERNGGGSGRERRRGRSYEEEWIDGKRRRGEY